MTDVSQSNQRLRVAPHWWWEQGRSRWYQSRVFFAWTNRCWRCLVKGPFHV